MVEKAPKPRGGGGSTLKSSFPRGVSLLGNMAPYVNTDVTNPRELYALLSDARDQGRVMASVRVQQTQAGGKKRKKLPPLDLSSELGSLERHPEHRSHPDLPSFRSEKGTSQPVHPDPVQRSSSLQDLHTIHLRHNGPAHSNKKLKPILRDNASTKHSVSDHSEKSGGVKFAQKEVHVIARDSRSSLPPIEGREDEGVRTVSRKVGSGNVLRPTNKASLFGAGLELGREEKVVGSATRSPRHQRRANGADLSSNIFPRGQPVEVKKPATPTYNDYPEAYWELRSATVQDPSDLKEDMIDRDRYRLKQISALSLKAVNREAAVPKLDSYRKWQQHMMAHSPPVSPVKQDSARGSETPRAAPSHSAKNGRQLRMSMPLQNDALAVAAISIGPNANSVTKKPSEISTVTRAPDRVVNTDSFITEEEFRRRQKIESAAKGENGTVEAEGKPVKATVVNLCIDPDRSSDTPTSDVYTGIKMITLRPSSDRAKAHEKPKPPESLSAASIKATMGSSQSHRLTRILSAPTETTVSTSVAQGGNSTETDSSVASKKILKKFNQLRVFNEKNLTRENAFVEPWEVVSSKPTEKSPYLPLSRPPTYKLDLKLPSHLSYLSSRHGEDAGALTDRAIDDPYLLLSRERGGVPLLGFQSPTKSNTPSLKFCFRDGEVIVSRQEKKKPEAT